MEGFLHNLGLTGPVAEYAKSLAAAGFYSPEDLLYQEPSISQLEKLGISNPRDRKLLHAEICPELNQTEDHYDDNPNFDIDLNTSPDFDIDPNDDGDNVVDEDEYAALKREYEIMMNGGMADTASPSFNDPTEDQDYEAMKAQYNALMSQSKSSVNVAGDDPGDFDFAAIDLSDLTVDLGETESEYDRLKAQYNNQDVVLHDSAKTEPLPTQKALALPATPSRESSLLEIEEYERAKAEYERMLLSDDVTAALPASTSPRVSPAASPRAQLLKAEPIHATSRSQVSPTRTGAHIPHSSSDLGRPSQRRPNMPGSARAALTSSANGQSTSPNNPTPTRTGLTTSAGGQPTSISPNRPAKTIGERTKELPKSLSSPSLSATTPLSRSGPTATLTPSLTSGALSVAVPIQGASIVGVRLTTDPAAQAQLEALKALAAQGNVAFGNELDIEVLEPSGSKDELLFSVRITTNMRQFSHLTFHRLDIQRRYVDFEELYKKIALIGNYGSTFPKFPKKKDKSNFMIFTLMMKIVARDPELHQLAFVVDFFDNHKYGPTAGKAGSSSAPRGSFFKKK